MLFGLESLPTPGVKSHVGFRVFSAKNLCFRLLMTVGASPVAIDLQMHRFLFSWEAVYCSNCIIDALIVVNKFPKQSNYYCGFVASPPAGIHDKGPVGLMNDPRLKSDSGRRGPIPFINIHLACHLMATHSIVSI